MVQQRQTYHHKDLRNALIETGIHLVNTEGVNSFSLRKVAAACGVSHAAPYSHFQNKEELLEAMQLFITDRFSKQLESAVQKNNNVVLDGLYSWDEYKILKNELDNLMVIAIICDKKIRYDRLATREFRPLTNEEASNRDVSEIENLAKGGPIAYADYYINNNGSIEEYYQRLNEILGSE